MIKHIKTSKANREVVSILTRKLSLGTENIIARIALAYSLSFEEKLDITNIKDSGGKEYSKSVLFGDYYDYYIALVSIKYDLYKTDSAIPKYIKMHIDDGLERIISEIDDNPNLIGFEYVIEKVEKGLIFIESMQKVHMSV